MDIVEKSAHNLSGVLLDIGCTGRVDATSMRTIQRVHDELAEEVNKQRLPSCDSVIDKGPWKAEINGVACSVVSDDFTHDVALHITGDFECLNQRFEYAEMIAKKLNRNE